jgi:hypothetical protein
VSLPETHARIFDCIREGISSMEAISQHQATYHKTAMDRIKELEARLAAMTSDEAVERACDRYNYVEGLDCTQEECMRAALKAAGEVV